MRVLVTGGSGFIGRAVIAELLLQGQEITATCHETKDVLPESPQIDWVNWDVTRSPLPDIEWKEIKLVLHLANPRLPFDFPSNAEEMYELAVGSTYRLLERARKEGLEGIAIASTGDVVGQGDAPIREDNIQYRPRSFYGACKASSEILALSYRNILPVSVLRFFHPYGPRGDQFLVNRLVLKILNGDEIEIEGEEGLALNPVHIHDLARGVVLSTLSMRSGIFHFAGPDTVTLRSLINSIAELVDRPLNIRVVQKRFQVNHVGIYKHSEMVHGYRPKVSLKDGLQGLVNSYLRT